MSLQSKPYGRGHTFTPRQITAVVDLYTAGEPYDIIAHRVLRSESSINSLIHRLRRDGRISSYRAPGRRRHLNPIHKVTCLGPLCRGKRTFRSRDPKKQRICQPCRTSMDEMRGGFAHWGQG